MAKKKTPTTSKTESTAEERDPSAPDENADTSTAADYEVEEEVDDSAPSADAVVDETTPEPDDVAKTPEEEKKELEARVKELEDKASDKEPPIQGVSRGLTVVEKHARSAKKILTRDLATFKFVKTAARTPTPPFNSGRPQGFNEWLVFMGELIMSWNVIQMVEEARRVRIQITNKGVADPDPVTAHNDAARLAVIFCVLQLRYRGDFEAFCEANNLNKQFDIPGLLEFSAECLNPNEASEESE